MVNLIIYRNKNTKVFVNLNFDFDFDSLFRKIIFLLTIH